ncbi:MAG TPA: hypothetical protein VHL57_02100 [Flavobacteriales bacterium]|jgi:hypothetical protein|nr:hypothetical protein [Flavobacteriales bacterium]
MEPEVPFHPPGEARLVGTLFLLGFLLWTGGIRTEAVVPARTGPQPWPLVPPREGLPAPTAGLWGLYPANARS